MRRGLWVIIACILLAIPAGCESKSVSEQGSLHVTFGTKAGPLTGRGTDRITFIDVAENGDIMVAGQGASAWSDDGSYDIKRPMVARINLRGEVIWQRIYQELLGHEIIAFASSGTDSFLILQQRIDYGALVSITLRSIDANGELSEVLGKLNDPLWVNGALPVIDEKLTHFVVAGKEGETSKEAFLNNVKLFRMNLDGRVSLSGQVSQQPLAISFLQHFQHIGDNDLIFSQMVTTGPADPPELDIDIIRVNEMGESSTLIELHRKMVSHIVASKKHLFLVTSIAWPNGPNSDTIRAYTIDGSRELWHYKLEEGKDIGAMQVLSSGNLVFIYDDYNGNVSRPVVSMLSSSGELLWEKRYQPSEFEGYTFLETIKELENGWLALVGSTGSSFGAFVSTDTNALVLVISPTSDGLNEYKNHSYMIVRPKNHRLSER